MEYIDKIGWISGGSPHSYPKYSLQTEEPTVISPQKNKWAENIK
jgi:hypothetical protein